MRRWLAMLMVGLLALQMMLIIPGTTAFATDLKLIEPDEPDGSSPPIGNAAGQFDIRSPYRTSSGADNWSYPITGMYNEPRSDHIHRGVDFGAPTGTAVYPVHGYSSSDDAYVTYIGSASSSSFGNHVIVRHRDRVSGVDYYFDTLYAHLASVDANLAVGKTVTATTRLGATGCTGSCTGPHLHLEFRTRYTTGSGEPRRHPPASFFQGKAPSPYWLDTSFITRMPNQGNCVRFRTVAKHSDGYYVASPVRIYYKVGLNGTWQNALMTPEGSSPCTPGSSTSQYHYFNLNNVATIGSDVFFYIRATETKYNRSSYRPWRHSDGSAPTDRPFYHYMQYP